jgi:integrase
MELTALQVEQAGTGKGKALAPGKHHDGNGLYLDVRTATSKSWCTRGTFNGKEIWIAIGSAKHIPLKRARELNGENRRLLAEGINPREHREAQRAARAVETAKLVTFEEMSERFIAAHEPGWRNAKHRRDWRNSLKSYVYPHIGALPLPAVDTASAMRVFQQPLDDTTFWLARPETATRVRGRCEQIWDAGKAQKLCNGESPFDWKTLKHLLPAKSKIHKVEHHAAVPWREIPALMAGLRARSSISARTLEFTILCASRVNEIVLARGREFDLANARWVAPAEHMKAGKQHTVMLAKRAVEIVHDLHPDGLKPDDLVFGVTGAALTKMLRLAGYGDATVHGTARASFKTWCDEATSIKGAVAESCLAHIEGDKVRAAYSRGEFEALRAQAMEMWSGHCASPHLQEVTRLLTAGPDICVINHVRSAELTMSCPYAARDSFLLRRLG